MTGQDWKTAVQILQNVGNIFTKNPDPFAQAKRRGSVEEAIQVKNSLLHDISEAERLLKNARKLLSID